MIIKSGLDIDDLFIIAELSRGVTVTEISRRLCITQPAVTQRIRKAERQLGGMIVLHEWRYVYTTAFGQRIGEKIAEALTLLGEIHEITKSEEASAAENEGAHFAYRV